VAKSDCTKGTLVSENTAATLPVAVAAVTAPASRGVTNEHSATFTILISLSLCHFLNDMNQSLVPAVYPILKQSYQLDFGQIGLIPGRSN
jgi:FSR family fosmidomycin resistance protein-like MFS transporter